MIKLTNVAKYYQQEDHQKKALDWLESQIDPKVLEVFAERYRSKPPDSVTVCEAAIEY